MTEAEKILQQKFQEVFPRWKSIDKILPKGQKNLILEAMEEYEALMAEKSLPIEDIEDYHIKRWSNGLETGVSIEKIREDMIICKRAMALDRSINWD